MMLEYRYAHEKGFIGIDGIRCCTAQGKTLVFAVTWHHAETLVEILNDEFAALKSLSGLGESERWEKLVK